MPRRKPNSLITTSEEVDRAWVPFTYEIEFRHPITGEKKYYYGVKYSKWCHPDDLFVTYFTNSKSVHQLLREYDRGCFTAEVDKTFPADPKQAREYANQKLHELNAVSRDDYLNKCISDGDVIHTKSGTYQVNKKPKSKSRSADTIVRECAKAKFYGYVRQHGKKKLIDEVFQDLENEKLSIPTLGSNPKPSGSIAVYWETLLEKLSNRAKVPS